MKAIKVKTIYLIKDVCLNAFIDADGVWADIGNTTRVFYTKEEAEEFIGAMIRKLIDVSDMEIVPLLV